MTAQRVVSCRSCGEAGLLDVLSLGETPIANALVDVTVTVCTVA